MKLEELRRMSEEKRLAWINTAKVQDLNTILKEAEMKGYSNIIVKQCPLIIYYNPI